MIFILDTKVYFNSLTWRSGGKDYFNFSAFFSTKDFKAFYEGGQFDGIDLVVGVVVLLDGGLGSLFLSVILKFKDFKT